MPDFFIHIVIYSADDIYYLGSIVAITHSLQNLSHWQQTAFCAALLERMLPNYKMFSEASSFGDYKLLRNQLDLVWQWLDKNSNIKINYSAQLAKLEDNIPDPSSFDFIGVFPALDAAMALMSLLQNMQDRDSEGFANVAKLSENSVSYYVELLLLDELADNNEVEISEEDINQHPLMEWEAATQKELFDYLTIAAEQKKTCIQAKELVLEEGLSNLGIEI